MKKLKYLTPLLLLSIGCSNINSNTITQYPFSCFGFIENNTYVQPLNTAVDVIMYNQNDLNNISSSFQEEVFSLHKQIDAYNSYQGYQGIYSINYQEGPIKVSDNLFALIKEGIALTKLSKGKLNIAIGNLIDVWKDYFDEGLVKNNDPDIEDINNAIASIPDYQNIENYIVLNEDTKEISLNLYNSKHINLNLGAIAKGYVLDKTHSLFENKPAIVSCGSSSIYLNGNFPGKDRDYYLLNLTEPVHNKLETSSIFCQFKINGGNYLSTSGDYEKYYYTKDNNTLRHHILNPETGYSSNYHAEICVFAEKSGTMLDALSTTLMNIESIEEIKNMVSSFEAYYNTTISYAIVDRDNGNYKMSCNSSFYNCIQKDKNSPLITSITMIN